MRSRLFVALLGLVAACAAAWPRLAIAGGSIHDVARAVPADVDVLVALDRACVARTTPGGRAVAAIAQQWISLDRVHGAWLELGATLGRTPEQTFDDLLGRRVTLMVRGLGEDKESWAIRAVVAPETERLLRERLRAAPRNIVAGRSVLAVEHGGLELVTARKGKWSVLLLGPANAPALFDELASTLESGPAAPLSADTRFASLEPLGDGEALVFVRHRGAKPGWFGCVAQTDADIVRIGLRAGSDSLEGCDTPVPLVTRAHFDRLAEGALLAALERPVAPRGRDSALGALLSQLPILALGPDQSVLIGDRLALLALPGEHGPVWGAALELRSASSAAPVIDALLGRALALAGVEGQAFAGLEPCAVRRAAVNPDALPAALAPMLAGQEVRWSFPPDARPHPAAGAMSATVDSVPEDAGWCIAATDEAAGARLRQAFTKTAACSRAEPADEARGPLVARWVSLGAAQPAQLVGAFRAAGVDVPKAAAAFSALERVEWSVRLDETNTLAGVVTIRAVTPVTAAR